MAKPENPAEAPVASRPPRPVQRVRLDASPEAPAVESRAAYIEALRSEALRAEALRARRAVVHPGADGAAHAGAVFDAATFDAAALDAAALDAAAFDAAAVERERRVARELMDDAFDTTRNLEAPGGLAAADALDASEGAFGEEGWGVDDGMPADDVIDDEDLMDDDGRAYAEGASVAPAVGARNPSAEPRPGLAWARRGSTESASRVPKLPVANLERPSTSRLELTPSPVPRVALAPATGAVDISLVPGPHTVGSRNLPTVAAQHLVGRRARRPAPAVTVPPPAVSLQGSALQSSVLHPGALHPGALHPGAMRGPGSALARDVRSSKGEIVLGLTIGLGVSLLLAGLGQAYLRGDVVAGEQVADDQGVPARVESVTLSARPESAPNPSARGASPGSAPAAAAPGVSASHHPSAANVVSAARVAPAGSAAADAPSRSRAGRRAQEAGVDNGAGDSLVLAQALASKRAERLPPRATPARAAQPRRAQPVVSDAPPLDALPVAAPLVAPASAPPPPPPASAPLTPAESAGLGLDLPL